MAAARGITDSTRRNLLEGHLLWQLPSALPTAPAGTCWRALRRPRKVFARPVDTHCSTSMWFSRMMRCHFAASPLTYSASSSSVRWRGTIIIWRA